MALVFAILPQECIFNLLIPAMFAVILCPFAQLAVIVEILL